VGGPKYELASLQYLASADCMISEEGPCRERLSVLFSGPSAASRRRKFCKLVVSRLQPSDYWKTATDMYCRFTGEEPFSYDEYGIELDRNDLEALGIEEVDGCWPTTWYVKMALVVFEGRKVHLLSLHCLEREMLRANGSRLSPRWDDGYRR
jgi:hypothetical protein